MRSQLLTIAIVIVVVSLSRADTIVIRDAVTGKPVAELNIDAKEPKFLHAGTTLTVERKAPVMELRARKWILPKVAFKGALPQVKMTPGTEKKSDTLPHNS